MRKEYAQPIRCPLCGRGRVIDAGPKIKTSEFTLLTQNHIDQAMLITKCPKCGEKVGIILKRS
mgnify:CR=1 FL=1